MIYPVSNWESKMQESRSESCMLVFTLIEYKSALTQWWTTDLPPRAEKSCDFCRLPYPQLQQGYTQYSSILIFFSLGAWPAAQKLLEGRKLPTPALIYTVVAKHIKDHAECTYCCWWRGGQLMISDGVRQQTVVWHAESYISLSKNIENKVWIL